MKKKLVSSLALAAVLTASLAPIARAESEGGNPDGFHTVGDWPGKDTPIKLPEVSAEQLEKMKNALISMAPEQHLKYADLFSAADQDALDQTQATILITLDRMSKDIYSLKQAFVRGVVSINELKKYGNPHQVGPAAETYRSYMKEKVNDLIGTLDMYSGNRNGGSYLYHKNEKGEIDGVVQGQLNQPGYYNSDAGATLTVGEVVFGVADTGSCPKTMPWTGDVNTMNAALAQACGWHAFTYDGALYTAANACKTEVCVFEVEKVAIDLLDSAYDWSSKVKFKKSGVNTLQVFYEPHNSTLRYLLSRYISDKLTNTDVNLLRYAITAITNVAYVPLVAPVDFVKNLGVVRTTLNFRPSYFNKPKSDGYNHDERKIMEERTRRNKMVDQFSTVANQKLHGTVQ